MSRIITQETYRKLASNLLDKRYDICNKDGHKDIVKNFCKYCFRHYPQTNEQKISDRHNGLIVLIDSLKQEFSNK